jgi:SWI/SNF-related matrix-associated actin-dependent regulator of chromatin subfamily A member 5
MISLYENKINGILADDMGLGKTIQAISVLAYLKEKSLAKNEPHLIIAPKSTISNWMREFARWTPDLAVVNLIPTAEHRAEILNKKMVKGKFDVCVTTYTALLMVPQL